MPVPAQKREQITRAIEMLDQLSYYQILNCPPASLPKDIKKAFLRRSQEFHPDVFFNEDDGLKAEVTQIYKRIAEAYQVLRNPDYRARYDKQIIADPKDIRFQLAEEAKKPLSGAVEATTKNSQSKRYLQLALNCIKKKDFSGAVMNLQFALKYDQNNESLQKKLEETQDLRDKADAEKNPYEIR